MTSSRAAFLDRDGVLNVDHGYTYKTKDLEWLPNVQSALAQLKSAGYLLIVISNQSGVARGMYSSQDVEAFHNEMNRQLQEASGVTFDQFYFCPHHPEGKVPELSIKCLCRKPGTKFVDEAVEKFNINRDQSFLVGDKASDLECAKRAGLRGLLVHSRENDGVAKNGNEVFPSLAAAVDEVLR